MKTGFLILLLVLHGAGSALAQQDMRELESTSVFSSAAILSACDAIANGNYLELPTLVDSAIDIDERGKDGCTLLLWCWCHGYHHAFEVLLEMGADPHATIDSDISVDVGGNRLTLTEGASVAAIAIRFSRVQPQFVEKVVRYLRDANQRDASGGTLLHNLMAAADDQPLVRKLPDAEQLESDSLTDLRQELTASGNGKLVQTTPFMLLYQAGVQVNAVDNSGFTALQQYMHWLEHSDVRLDRLDVAATKAISLFQRTEYFDEIDARAKFITDMERLLKDRNLMRMGSSMLDAFKQRGQQHYDSMRAKRGNVRFGDYGQFLFAEMYPDSLDEEVCLALEGVPYINRDQIVRSFAALSDIGFDANARGKAGFTHLFAAYLAKNETGFEALLKLGTDPDLRLEDDLWQFVPAGIQSSAGAAFCPERGETVLLSAALNPDREPYIRLAMKFTDAIDLRDNLNRNMLHRILYYPLPQDQKTLVTELVQAGVDLNGQSIGGATPCHEAVFRNAAIIPELVLLGADPNIQDRLGRTVKDVLRMSIEQKWTFHEESAKALGLLDRLAK